MWAKGKGCSRTIDYDTFTPCDINRSIASLCSNKACGIDVLFAEHLLHASPEIHVLLSICFNAFIVHGFLPNPLKDTVLVPIVKDKPWVTDVFRLLVRKRQRAHMSGHFAQEKILRNKVNRAATKLRYDFYQKHVTALSDTGSHDWWDHMKKPMGIETNDSLKMPGLANKGADGNCEILANSIMHERFFCVC